MQPLLRFMISLWSERAKRWQRQRPCHKFCLWSCIWVRLLSFSGGNIRWLFIVVKILKWCLQAVCSNARKKKRMLVLVLISKWWAITTLLSIGGGNVTQHFLHWWTILLSGNLSLTPQQKWPGFVGYGFQSNSSERNVKAGGHNANSSWLWQAGQRKC